MADVRRRGVGKMLMQWGCSFADGMALEALVGSTEDVPELTPVTIEAYEAPRSSLCRLLCPAIGPWLTTRDAALRSHAWRLDEWHVTNEGSYWKRVVDVDTGTLVVAALWMAHKSHDVKVKAEITR